jgi:hypothetical protein
MSRTRSRSLDEPDESMAFDYGRIDWVVIAEQTIGRTIQEPGGEQYEIVQRISVAPLRDASDQTANSIAVALASLPPVRVTLPLDLLAGHPSPWMRALAAVVWAQRPDEPAEIGVTLAQHPSPHVRGSLARSLENDARHAKPRAILSEDPRRSVRQQVKPPS